MIGVSNSSNRSNLVDTKVVFVNFGNDEFLRVSSDVGIYVSGSYALQCSVSAAVVGRLPGDIGFL